MLQTLFRQYSEAPQIGCVFVIHLLTRRSTLILNQKLIVNRYQLLILIVIDSLKLKYLLIQQQRLSCSTILTLTQTLKLIQMLTLTRTLKLTRMLTPTQTLIQTRMLKSIRT